MAEDLKQKVLDLIEPALRAEGFEIADMALSRYRTSVLMRVYVYGESGPTLAQCSHLSNVIGNVIEGTELFAGGYTLEVSSPGLDRPLKTSRDFRYRVGETVKIAFVDSKRKAITAEIVSATEDSVTFREKDKEFDVPLAEIERAKIQF
ncbi:MAG: ribosome maturation factor RimP [bacterium]|nr:ribosome maturation factor RimP [bacterium]